MGNSKITFIKDLFLNYFMQRKLNLSYVVESADWSIKQDGIYITENLRTLGLLKAAITTSHFGLREQIVHFGSLNTFVKGKGFRKPHRSNKVVVTCFHLVPDDPRVEFLKIISEDVDFFHTSCNITKNQLVDFGIDSTKIIVIPLGVDLSLFKPPAVIEKQKIKKLLGIPEDKTIIGSFQKDGVGWGEGLEPKLIKGPDIFINTVKELSKHHPVFVLLAGPARGYVKKGLEKFNISYKSVGYLKNLSDIAKYYNALDLYLITSRIEGGPKQILEAWASGVPVVTTKVGMIPDIAEDGKKVLMTDTEDIMGLVNRVCEVIDDGELSHKLVLNSLSSIKNYSWDIIAKHYYHNIYRKLITKQ